MSTTTKYTYNNDKGIVLPLVNGRYIIKPGETFYLEGNDRYHRSVLNALESGEVSKVATPKPENVIVQPVLEEVPVVEEVKTEPKRRTRKTAEDVAE